MIKDFYRSGFFLISLLFNYNAWASQYAAEVKNVETSMQKNAYVLAVNLEYHLSPQANEALQNGVPLNWLIKIKFKKQHDFWFDKTQLKLALRYRLQYHALLKMYRVKNENTGSVNSFTTLAAALNAMATVRDLPLVETKNVSSDANYSIAIKVFFEDGELPLPLQTQVIANSQWQLSSEWTQWNFLKADAPN